MTDKRYVGFGERLGYQPAFSCGLEDAPPHLRNAIWNLCHQYLASYLSSGSTVRRADAFIVRMAVDKHWVAREFKSMPDSAQITFLQQFVLSKSSWHEVYELLESFPRWAGYSKASTWIRPANEMLIAAGSPWRMTATGVLTPIVSPEELKALEVASLVTGRYAAASEHMRAAGALFGMRPSPDYDNAVKEAASAVESAIKLATAESDVGPATKKFGAAYGVHPALMESANKLFGYASDRDGVRHGARGTGNPVDFDEAKLAIVAASAWVNFIIAKAP